MRDVAQLLPDLLLERRSLEIERGKTAGLAGGIRFQGSRGALDRRGMGPPRGVDRELRPGPDAAKDPGVAQGARLRERGLLDGEDGGDPA